MLGIVAFLVAGYYLLENTKEKTVTTTTEDNSFVFATADTHFAVAYSNDGDTATVTIDGQQYELDRVVSWSGARYTNKDESVVFWEHQGEASLEINGETVAEGAKLITTERDATTTADTLTFNVGPEKVDCVGVGPQKCLMINNEMFYDTIAGFDYIEGNSYVIEVERKEKTNVPADASAYEYTLVNITSINGKENDIVFDAENKVWKDKYGICHTCTVENGFNADGTMSVDIEAEATTNADTGVSSLDGKGVSYNGGTITFADGRYMANFVATILSANTVLKATVWSLVRESVPKKRVLMKKPISVNKRSSPCSSKEAFQER